MSATLIVENGTGIAGANCYGDISDIETYADAFGITIPENNDLISQAAIRATAYIDSKKYEYQGLSTYVPGLAWPRGAVENYRPQFNPNYLAQYQIDAYLGLGLVDSFNPGCGFGELTTTSYGFSIIKFWPSTVIPPDVIAAYFYLACQAANNVNLFLDRTTAFLQQRSIGQSGLVSIYNADKIQPKPQFDIVNKMLHPFIRHEGALRSSRF